jgi:hypothetical protein
VESTDLTNVWQNQQECYFTGMNKKMKNGRNEVQTQNTGLKISKNNSFVIYIYIYILITYRGVENFTQNDVPEEKETE